MDCEGKGKEAQGGAQHLSERLARQYSTSVGPREQRGAHETKRPDTRTHTARTHRTATSGGAPQLRELVHCCKKVPPSNEGCVAA